VATKTANTTPPNGELPASSVTIAKTSPNKSAVSSPAGAVIGGQQKSLTDALNEIIPSIFEDLEDIQPLIDHELIHSDLFRTAESLFSSTIFAMCIDNYAGEITR
jgi:hypothetical protein